MKKEKLVRKKAAALAYDHIGVPRVVAKGEGRLAERIIERAKELDVPIEDNPVLVEALMQVELSKEIPPELYQTVAEVLAFIYRMDKIKRDTE